MFVRSIQVWRALYFPQQHPRMCSLRFSLHRGFYNRRGRSRGYDLPTLGDERCCVSRASHVAWHVDRPPGTHVDIGHVLGIHSDVQTSHWKNIQSTLSKMRRSRGPAKWTEQSQHCRRTQKKQLLGSQRRLANSLQRRSRHCKPLPTVKAGSHTSDYLRPCSSKPLKISCKRTRWPPSIGAPSEHLAILYISLFFRASFFLDWLDNLSTTSRTTVYHGQYVNFILQVPQNLCSSEM